MIEGNEEDTARAALRRLPRVAGLTRTSGATKGLPARTLSTAFRASSRDGCRVRLITAMARSTVASGPNPGFGRLKPLVMEDPSGSPTGDASYRMPAGRDEIRRGRHVDFPLTLR